MLGVIIFIAFAAILIWGTIGVLIAGYWHIKVGSVPPLTRMYRMPVFIYYSWAFCEGPLLCLGIPREQNKVVAIALLADFFVLVVLVSVIFFASTGIIKIGNKDIYVKIDTHMNIPAVEITREKR